MGSEREVKSLREANEAGQHLMFAHRSSDCHLGWQIIKCVNQGQAWKWQGEACETRLAVKHQRKESRFEEERVTGSSTRPEELLQP